MNDMGRPPAPEAKTDRPESKTPSGKARFVNGILNLTRVCRDRQFQSDPPGVVAVLPAEERR